MPTHDPLALIVTFAGVSVPPSGEGDFVSHEFPESLAAYTGNDGDTVFSLNPDESVEVTITCSPYSDAHAALGAIYATQLALGSNAEGFPYAYRNVKNGDFVNAERALISQPPPMNGSREAGEVEWSLRLSRGVKGYGTVLPFYALAEGLAQA